MKQNIIRLLLALFLLAVAPISHAEVYSEIPDEEDILFSSDPNDYRLLLSPYEKKHFITTRINDHQIEGDIWVTIVNQSCYEENGMRHTGCEVFCSLTNNDVMCPLDQVVDDYRFAVEEGENLFIMAWFGSYPTHDSSLHLVLEGNTLASLGADGGIAEEDGAVDEEDEVPLAEFNPHERLDLVGREGEGSNADNNAAANSPKGGGACSLSLNSGAGSVAKAGWLGFAVLIGFFLSLRAISVASRQTSHRA